MPGHLLCLGYGYCAQYLAADLMNEGWTVSGSSRDQSGLAEIEATGARAVHFDGEHPLPPSQWDGVSHLLISAPPGPPGDPVLAHHHNTVAAMSGKLSWVGYLSTTGVYGNRDGGWVDEGSPLKPTSERSRRRVEAERQWLALFHDHGLPVHIFRLAGIYGPGRNQLVSLKEGRARRIDKPGQVFSRIHVEDVAAVLKASIAAPRPGATYNVCDTEAAEPAAVVAYAAELLGMPAPPLVPIKDAQLSDMALSFYDDNKRVRNRLLTQELGIDFRYPTYREGLQRELERL